MRRPSLLQSSGLAPGHRHVALFSTSLVLYQHRRVRGRRKNSPMRLFMFQEYDTQPITASAKRFLGAGDSRVSLVFPMRHCFTLKDYRGLTRWAPVWRWGSTHLCNAIGKTVQWLYLTVLLPSKILHNLFPSPDKRNGSCGIARNRLDWQSRVRATYNLFVKSDANQPHNQKAIYQGLDHNVQPKFRPLTLCALVLQPDDIGVILLGLPHNVLRRGGICVGEGEDMG